MELTALLGAGAQRNKIDKKEIANVTVHGRASSFGRQKQACDRRSRKVMVLTAHVIACSRRGFMQRIRFLELGYGRMQTCLRTLPCARPTQSTRDEKCKFTAMTRTEPTD